MSKDGDQKGLSGKALQEEIQKRKDNAAKKKKAMDESIRLNKVLYERFSPVVDDMMMIQNFIMDLFENQDTLKQQFKGNEKVCQKIDKILKETAMYFTVNFGAEGDSKMPEKRAFLRALEELAPTKGYSMINYFKINKGLGQYFVQNIEKINDLHSQYQQSLQKKSPGNK